MASRWLQAKRAKMAAQAKANAKPGSHRGGHTIETSNRKSAELSALIARYTGVVTLCDPGRQTGTWNKRGGSLMGAGLGAAIAVNGHKGVARNTNGNYYDLWGSGDRLIRR